MNRCVALYCRLSPRPDGSYEGVDAQEKWGRGYAEQYWPGVLVEVFADAGISAARDDRRPEYERLREWIGAGRVAHVWAVEQSRLERREVQWFGLAAELDAAGIGELHTNRDGIVRVRDEVAGIKAVLNAAEVRKMRGRVIDTLATKAANGEPGGARPYGYVRATKVESGKTVKTYAVVPEQAEIIREAAERILSGWSLGAIASDLAARRLKAPHGGQMIGEAVRRMLVAPAVAGKRRHGEQMYPGNWAAILDEDTWQAVRARLAAPRTVRRSDGGLFVISERHARRPPAPRRYLLTGSLAICGACGAPLVGSLKQARLRKGETRDSRRPSIPYYLCHGNKGGKGCIGVQVAPVEAYVADQLFTHLDSPEFRAAVAADEHAEQRDRLTRALDALDVDRADLAREWGAGRLRMDEWREGRAGIDGRENGLRAELAELPPAPGRLGDVEGTREAWPEMDLGEQREVLRTCIHRVVVNRARPGVHVFEPSRVEIVWRTA